MARPFLADPAFVRKAADGRADQINTCIACNQACLDYIFTDRPATCLVNPQAGRELEFASLPAPTAKRRVAVVGAGAAGMACAVAAAERGHKVTLFEAEDDIGGQLNWARAVPGKQEFDELMRYFRRRLDLFGVELRVGTAVDLDTLRDGDYDRVVISTGVRPRMPAIDGIDHPSVISYPELLSGRIEAGRRVAVIGAGGIGFDVAELLTAEHAPDGHASDGDVANPAIEAFREEWGIDASFASRGGLMQPHEHAGERKVWLLQRKESKVGAGLAKTTGWIRRALLKHRGVVMMAGVEYLRIDDEGLHVSVDSVPQVLAVDTVVICAGQEPRRELVPGLVAAGIPHELIGGAEVALELDARRAIAQGTKVALGL